MNTKPRPQAAAALAALLAALAGPMLRPRGAGAEQPPAPCHPNPQAAQDSATVLARGDVAALPGPLKDRLQTPTQGACQRRRVRIPHHAVVVARYRLHRDAATSHAGPAECVVGVGDS